MKSLLELREDKKLTREEVAKRAGISVAYIYMIEKKQRNPSDKLKKKLAKIYNVSPTTIFLASDTTNC